MQNSISRILILNELAKGPRHGYALAKLVSKLKGQDGDKEPQVLLYETLKRMANDELVNQAAGTVEVDSKQRRMITLTDKGQALLEASKPKLIHYLQTALELLQADPDGEDDE